MKGALFIADGPLSGPENMRRDLHLLAGLDDQMVYRVYFWEGPWVSLGRFQIPSEALAPGFDQYVIRPTGGQAVLHGNDLTVSVVKRFEGRSVKKAYEFALAPILAALCESGRPACLAGSDRSTKVPGADCFAATSPFDIIDPRSGQKVAGAAMRMERDRLLLQVCIPIGDPLITPSTAIRNAVEHPVSAWSWKSFGSVLTQQEEFTNG